MQKDYVGLILAFTLILFTILGVGGEPVSSMDDGEQTYDVVLVTEGAGRAVLLHPVGEHELVGIEGYADGESGDGCNWDKIVFCHYHTRPDGETAGCNSVICGGVSDGQRVWYWIPCERDAGKIDPVTAKQVVWTEGKLDDAVATLSP